MIDGVRVIKNLTGIFKKKEIKQNCEQTTRKKKPTPCNMRRFVRF